MKKLVLGILHMSTPEKQRFLEGILYKTGEIRKWGRVDQQRILS